MYEIIYMIQKMKDACAGTIRFPEFKLLAKTLRTIDLLKMNGPLLRAIFKTIGEWDIIELRAKQGSDITRVLYFFIVGKKAVLTNGFIKIAEDTKGRKRTGKEV